MSFVAGCKDGLSTEQARTALSGEYDLHVGTDQVLKRADLLSDRLVLNPDGTCSQVCDYKGGNRVNTSGGKWDYDEDNGTVTFTRFRDCAGVRPILYNYTGQQGDGPAGLLVKFSDPPMIFLYPDTDVYYKRVKKI